MFGNVGIDLCDTRHYGGGEHLGRRILAKRHRNQIERAGTHRTPTPSSRSRSQSAISGRPTSAFGSVPPWQQ